MGAIINVGELEPFCIVKGMRMWQSSGARLIEVATTANYAEGANLGDQGIVAAPARTQMASGAAVGLLGIEWS
jgi:hypothetical protein